MGRNINRERELEVASHRRGSNHLLACGQIKAIPIIVGEQIFQRHVVDVVVDKRGVGLGTVGQACDLCEGAYSPRGQNGRKGQTELHDKERRNKRPVCILTETRTLKVKSMQTTVCWPPRTAACILRHKSERGRVEKVFVVVE
jgi:hypothetical protein